MTSSSVPIPSIPTAHNAANAIARHVRAAANGMTQDPTTDEADLGRPPSHTGLQEEGDGGATVGPSIEERERKREHHPAGGTRKVRTVPPFAAFDPPSPVMSPRILPTDDDVPRSSQIASPIPAQGQAHKHRHNHYPHLSLSSDLTRTLSSDDCQGGADQPPTWWTFAKPGRWKQVQTLHNAWVEQMMANDELRKESEHLGRDYFASKRGSAVGSTIGLGAAEEGQAAGRQQGENQGDELVAANSGETPLRHPHIHALRPPFAMSGLQSTRAGGSYFHLGKLRRRSVSQEDFNNPESSSPSPFHLPAGATTGGTATPHTQFHTPVQTPMPAGTGTPSSAAIGTAATAALQKGRHRARFKAMSLPVSRRQSTDNTRAGTPSKPSALISASAVGGVYQPPNTGEPETSENVSAAGIGHKATGHQVTGFVLGPPIEYFSERTTTTAGGDSMPAGPPQSSSAAWSARAVDGEHHGGGVESATTVPSTPPSRLLSMQPVAPQIQTGEARSSLSQNISDSPTQLTTSPDTSSGNKAIQAKESIPMSPHRKGHHPNFSITLPPPAFAPAPTTETTRQGGTATATRADGVVPPPPPPMFPQPHRHQAQAPPTPLGWDAPWHERDLVGRRFERANRAEEAGNRNGAGLGKSDSGYGGTGCAVSDPWLQPFEETAFDTEEGEDGCSPGSPAGGRGWRRSEERGLGNGGSESSGGPLTAGMGMSEKNAGRHRSLGGKKSRGNPRTGKNQSGDRGKMSKWAMLRRLAVKNPPGTRRAKLRKYFIFDARSTLYLRLATLVGIATSLGLGAKLFSLENAGHLDGILGSAPILSISYGSVSAIHCLVVMYREAFGKPIGLWGLRSKMTWVCLDLFFIALWSSCLSLTISDYMSSPLQCSSLNPWWTTGTYTITLPEVITKSHQKDKMCDRQAALIGFVLFTLIMYVINMVISLFRIFERLSTVAKSYEKSRVGQLV
ncbi:hypothetical protein QFC21_002299 [Naganishia friedmannii]|uniref:Uncharacterized protein n=1 Tax=Naganishia friedmannii TaxID=89922 RepID=A0ACC2VWY1_9TREE|nr:hypothetical protein QFC21_002299 [Naganishia friedmannii]